MGQHQRSRARSRRALGRAAWAVGGLAWAAAAGCGRLAAQARVGAETSQQPNFVPAPNPLEMPKFEGTDAGGLGAKVSAVVSSVPGAATLGTGTIVATVAVVLLLAGLVLFLVVRRVLSSGRSSAELDMATGLNIMGLSKSGKLTPEEAAAVRQAMARQMERQGKAGLKAPRGLSAAAALQLDPDVAQKVAEAQERAASGGLGPGSGAVASDTATAPEIGNQPAAAGYYVPEVAWDPLDEVAAAPAAPAASGEPDELPPELRALAERGLLTAEEIERIKGRMRGQ